MAIEDIYKNIYMVTKSEEADGTGGFEFIYKVGRAFRGSVVKANSGEQQLAAIRDTLEEQYNVTTAKNTKLVKDDIIMFRTNDNERVFLRINDNPLYPPPNKLTFKWKGVTATRFEPDGRVVEDGTSKSNKCVCNNSI